jgi:hypothetical protein
MCSFSVNPPEPGESLAGERAQRALKIPRTLDSALRAVAAPFELVDGRPDHLEVALTALAQELEGCAVPEADAALQSLLPLLRRGLGPLATALYTFIEQRLPDDRAASPWILGMLASRDAKLRARAVQLAVDRARAGSLSIDRALVVAVARALAAGAATAPDRPVLEGIGDILDRLPANACMARNVPSTHQKTRPICMRERLLLDESATLRQLAARVLDASVGHPGSDLVAALVGDEAARVLGPHLAFTRATHVDLVALTRDGGLAPALVRSVESAERLVGRELLSQVIAHLGWTRVRWGITIRPITGLRAGNSFPLVVPSAEAFLVRDAPRIEHLWDRFLIVAHGDTESDVDTARADENSVHRFRRTNLIHAALLGQLIDPAPLTVARVRRILDLTDQVVGGFQELFHQQVDETARIAEIYQRLRTSILDDLGASPGDRQVSADMRRRVQMFEDPKSPDDIETLHGLKRYLHQAGLRHAFRIFRSGMVSNRTVAVVLTSDRVVLETTSCIRYIDFEPDADSTDGGPSLPVAVQLAVQMVQRQLTHRRTKLPGVELLCYGNEVQVFISFRNHPAFLRIDLSPPLNGGMIDLEYFAVSQYDMDSHPDLRLRGIRLFLEQLDFDVSNDGFRLRARYDKERALDLGDIFGKTAAIFRLVPYLMDIDWVLGSLEYTEPARNAVARAWSRFLSRWGVLPTEELLTRDRLRVLAEERNGPGGVDEIAWDGRNEYTDRFSHADLATIWNVARERLQAGGMHHLCAVPPAEVHDLAQLSWEEHVSEPLARARMRGELVVTPDGLVPAAPEAFRRVHEARLVAQTLIDGGTALADAARTAAIVRAIERHVGFEVTGSVDGYAVERALLPLRGEPATLFILRDADGVPRLGVAIAGDVLVERNGEIAARLTSAELTRRLRTNNYLLGDSLPAVASSEIQALNEAFATPNPNAPFRPLAGDRSIVAIPAAPGRGTGFVRFDASKRSCEHDRDAVFVVPALLPEDAPLLRHAVGVVSTGGGALSHAGLFALELHKPALIVPGRWEGERNGAGRLVVRRAEYTEEETTMGTRALVLRHDITSREEVLDEGDLVTVDADTGLLILLGHDPETLALHEELQRLVESENRLEATVASPRQKLTLRGALVRATHQLGRILARLASPALARHAVRELLLTGGDTPAMRDRARRGALMRVVTSNPLCGEIARGEAKRVVESLRARLADVRRDAVSFVSTSESVFDILFTRLMNCRIQDALTSARASLGDDAGDEPDPDLDTATTRRLDALRRRVLTELAERLAHPDETHRLHHLLRRIEQLSALLEPLDDRNDIEQIAQARKVLRAATTSRIARHADRLVIHPTDGGIELVPLIGSKAANLGELTRLLGPECVPGWFTITDRAFRDILAGPPGPAAERLGVDRQRHPSLEAAIESILERQHTTDAARSTMIRLLWQALPLPAALVDAVQAGYRDFQDEPLVAVRSSALEEDTETSAWAGLFDTFLFVRGVPAILEHLKRAWAGLWTERAIQQRRFTGVRCERTGGGVIIQRMVASRVSGVLHTIWAVGDRPRETLINAAWGLGEGVVSGTVDADEILVPRVGRLQERVAAMRYRVGDKREQILFDARRGVGTRREPVVLHHRRQPALDRSEVLDLVHDASRLEAEYGCPLDIEFAYECEQLRILQVRPIPIHQFVLSEILARYPLDRRKHAHERKRT